MIYHHTDLDEPPEGGPALCPDRSWWQVSRPGIESRPKSYLDSLLAFLFWAATVHPRQLINLSILSRFIIQTWMKPLKGARPVPGPIMMTGVSAGNRTTAKELSRQLSILSGYILWCSIIQTWMNPLKGARTVYGPIMMTGVSAGNLTPATELSRQLIRPLILSLHLWCILVQTWMKPLKGARPVPGPIMMTGVWGRE